MPQPEDAISAQDEIRDPYLLEFLNLKDEYSESELEDALIRHLEWFLLELGNGFTFVARQKRIRVGNARKPRFGPATPNGHFSEVFARSVRANLRVVRQAL